MIERENRDGIELLRLAHGKVNAIDVELLERVAAEMARLREDRPRALVVTGSGRNFSAGLDLPRFLAEGPEYARRITEALHDALLGLHALPVPTVAAVNGHAIAGGFVLACACDARIVENGSGRFGITELPVGVPFPVAPLEMVRQALGTQRTRELAYGGHLIDAPASHEIGFATELTSPGECVDRALALAGRWGANPADAFAWTKRQLQAPTLDRIDKASAAFGAELDRVWSEPSTRSAIQAFVDKTLG